MLHKVRNRRLAVADGRFKGNVKWVQLDIGKEKSMHVRACADSAEPNARNPVRRAADQDVRHYYQHNGYD